MMNRILNTLLMTACAANLPPAHATDIAQPRLVIDSPSKGQVLDGGAVIKFHTEGISMAPEFGDTAAARQPAVGHLHVTVDDNRWFWIHDSAEQIIIAGLTPGPHKVSLQLADPNHRPLDKQTAEFSMGTSDNKNESEIRALIQRFHDAIVGKKKQEFAGLFLNQHIPWLGVFDEAAAAKIKLQQPSWGKVIPYANDTYLSFIDDIVASKAIIEEKMDNIRIETDGHVGTVTSDYSFNVGSHKQNWGKESWHLLHTEQGWKISSVIYSVTFNPVPDRP